MLLFCKDLIDWLIDWLATFVKRIEYDGRLFFVQTIVITVVNQCVSLMNCINCNSTLSPRYLKRGLNALTIAPQHTRRSHPASQKTQTKVDGLLVRDFFAGLVPFLSAIQKRQSIERIICHSDDTVLHQLLTSAVPKGFSLRDLYFHFISGQITCPMPCS